MNWTQDIRQRIIEVAERSEGLLGPALAPLCGLVGSDWEKELLYPFGGGHGVSTCGLVAAGILFQAGIATPTTWRPYAPECEREKAIARLWQFGIAHHAIRKHTEGGSPKPGDVLVIGSGMCEHALIAIEIADGRIRSIDGGQVGPKGLQAIKAVSRPWTVDRLNAMVGSRVVQFWIDVEALPIAA